MRREKCGEEKHRLSILMKPRHGWNVVAAFSGDACETQSAGVYPPCDCWWKQQEEFWSRQIDTVWWLSQSQTERGQQQTQHAPLKWKFDKHLGPILIWPLRFKLKFCHFPIWVFYIKSVVVVTDGGSLVVQTTVCINVQMEPDAGRAFHGNIWEKYACSWERFEMQWLCVCIYIHGGGEVSLACWGTDRW